MNAPFPCRHAESGRTWRDSGCKRHAAGEGETRRRVRVRDCDGQGTSLPCSGETLAGAHVTSGLSVLAWGLPVDRLAAAIPPSCRRGVDAAGTAGTAVRVEGKDVILETPAWAVAGATHLVPSFSALTDASYTLRLEVAARVGGAWTPWIAGASLGPDPFEPLPSSAPLAVDIDVFRSPTPFEAVRVRARLRPAAAPDAIVAAPRMLSLSASAAPPPSRRGLVAARGVQLAVPPLSQMEVDPALGRRICSPTCVAMVLDYWRRPAPTLALAAEMFHPGTDLYGIWPAAIVAAGRHGVAGYLLRFPDWAAATWCLEQGLPVIASVRYAKGELSGAAVAETPGHLLVLTGVDGDEVLVNDPAAASAGGVARRYHADELARVWLERTGIGYVLFPPDH